MHMPSLNDVSCSIIVNGRPLTVYPRPKRRGEKILMEGYTDGYIEASCGVEFSVQCSISDTYDWKESNTMRVLVAHNVMHCHHLIDQRYMSRLYRDASTSGDIHSGEKNVEEFQFGNLITTADKDDDFMPGSGAIVVTFERGVQKIEAFIVQPTSNSSSLGTSTEAGSTPPDSRKSSKRKLDVKVETSAKPLDEHPLAVFVFRYRSRAFLEQLGVLKPQSTVGDTDDRIMENALRPLKDRDEDDLTIDEARTLIRQLKREAESSSEHEKRRKE